VCRDADNFDRVTAAKVGLGHRYQVQGHDRPFTRRRWNAVADLPTAKLATLLLK
jgi:hypothetical protein